MGHVEVRRRVWWRKGQSVAAPADEWLNGDAPRISLGACERCCRIGRHPRGFKRSAADLQRLAGWSVSPERLRRIVEGQGQRAAKLRESSEFSPQWSASDCRVSPQGVSRIYVGVDGFMAPMVTQEEKRKRAASRRRAAESKRRRENPDSQGGERKRDSCEKTRGCVRGRRRRMRRGHSERYKEFKLATFYDQDKQRRRVSATGGNAERLGGLLRREGRRLGVARADEVVGIVDGAPWIRNQLERFGECDHIGLDYYHFSEHVSEAARNCFGEGTEAASAWRQRVLALALESGVDEVLDEITQTRQRLRAKTKREVLRRLRNYIGERVAMIRYPDSRAKGWDIGSGPTEGSCKTMAARLKGSGMRWDPAGAQAMLDLTALEDSNEWEDYWHNLQGHQN